jgi:hypothetical protein
VLGKIFNFRKSEKEACHSVGLVLHVQEVRGDQSSSYAPLQSCQRFVGIEFSPFWVRVDHASKGGGVVG